MLTALVALESGSSGSVRADLHAELGRALTFLGRLDEAATHIEQALALAAALDLPRVLIRSLGAKGLVLASLNRMLEAVAMTSAAIDVAGQRGFATEEAYHRMNLGDMLLNSDLPGAVVLLEDGLARARRLGDGDGQAFGLHNLSITHFYTGRWDDSQTAAEDAVEAAPTDRVQALVRWPLVVLQAARGDIPQTQRHLSAMESLIGNDDWGDQAALGIGRAAVAMLERDFDQALTTASAAVHHAMGLHVDAFRFAWPVAIEAALAVQRPDEARRLLALVAGAPPGHVPPYLRAQLSRYTALLDAAEDNAEDVETNLRRAIATLTDLAYPYWLGRAQFDLASWLIHQHREDEVECLLAEARKIFSGLRAGPDLDAVEELLVARDSAPAREPGPLLRPG
jgi:tetratricopeptide (TPR) repeat protein